MVAGQSAKADRFGQIRDLSKSPFTAQGAGKSRSCGNSGFFVSVGMLLYEKKTGSPDLRSGASVFFVFRDIFHDVAGLAVQYAAERFDGGGGNGLVVPDSLLRLGVDAFVAQLVIGKAVFAHIFPQRSVRNRHNITSFLLYEACTG